MKKNYSIRIFNILARRVYKISKKRKLGWTWRECQKWTSANLFKQYKGKPLSKIKVTEVDAVIVGILDSAPAGGAPMPTPEKEVCASPFDIPTKDLKDIDWWLIGDVLDLLDSNLKIRVAISGILDTGIVKKFEIPESRDVVRDLRMAGFSSDEKITFKILVAPNKKDDGQPCSYYLLVTEIGSTFDTDFQDDEIFKIVSETDISKDAKKKREEILKEKERREKERRAESQSKKKERPKAVEGEKEAQKKLAEETLKNLENLFSKGLISEELYKMNVKELKQKLEKGGKI